MSFVPNYLKHTTVNIQGTQMFCQKIKKLMLSINVELRPETPNIKLLFIDAVKINQNRNINTPVAKTKKKTKHTVLATHTHTSTDLDANIIALYTACNALQIPMFTDWVERAWRSDIEKSAVWNEHEKRRMKIKEYRDKINEDESTISKI